jgi:DNA polymerase III subunit alpha
VSPPDFDIDFCMRRRGEVIDYVREKYGNDCVANIITYGTLGAKMVIRDVARVHNLPFAEADRLAKMIPTSSTSRSRMPSRSPRSCATR